MSINTVKTTKKIIESLKKQINIYEKELREICSHKNVSFDKHLYNDDYLFICNDCGMHFVTGDPNFTYSE